MKVFPDARLLRDVVDAVSAVLDYEAAFKIAEDGISVRGMDSGHIALINLELSHVMFEEWDVEPGEATLSLTDIRKVLNPRKGQNAILEISEEEAKTIVAIGMAQAMQDILKEKNKK